MATPKLFSATVINSQCEFLGRVVLPIAVSESGSLITVDENDYGTHRRMHQHFLQETLHPLQPGRPRRSRYSKNKDLGADRLVQVQQLSQPLHPLLRENVSVVHPHFRISKPPRERSHPRQGEPQRLEGGRLPTSDWSEAASQTMHFDVGTGSSQTNCNVPLPRSVHGRLLQSSMPHLHDGVQRDTSVVGQTSHGGGGAAAETSIVGPKPVSNVRQVQSSLPTLQSQRKINVGNLGKSGPVQGILEPHQGDAPKIPLRIVRDEERLWKGSSGYMEKVLGGHKHAVSTAENTVSGSDPQATRRRQGKAEKNSSEGGGYCGGRGDYLLNVDDLPRSLKKLFLKVDFSNHFLFWEELQKLAGKSSSLPSARRILFRQFVRTLYLKCFKSS